MRSVKGSIYIHPPPLDTTLEVPVQKGGTWRVFCLPSPQPRAEEKGPLTMRTAAIGMAVFMKTVKEAQGEVGEEEVETRRWLGWRGWRSGRRLSLLGSSRGTHQQFLPLLLPRASCPLTPSLASVL